MNKRERNKRTAALMTLGMSEKDAVLTVHELDKGGRRPLLKPSPDGKVVLVPAKSDGSYEFPDPVKGDPRLAFCPQEDSPGSVLISKRHHQISLGEKEITQLLLARGFELPKEGVTMGFHTEGMSMDFLNEREDESHVSVSWWTETQVNPAAALIEGSTIAPGPAKKGRTSKPKTGGKK